MSAVAQVRQRIQPQTKSTTAQLLIYNADRSLKPVVLAALQGDRTAIGQLVQVWCTPLSQRAPTPEGEPLIVVTWPANVRPVCVGDMSVGGWQALENDSVIEARYTCAAFAWTMVALHGTPATLARLAEKYHVPTIQDGDDLESDVLPIALERPYQLTPGDWHVQGLITWRPANAPELYLTWEPESIEVE